MPVLRRATTGVLAALLTLGVVACGTGSKQPSTAPTTEPETPTTTAPPTAAPTTSSPTTTGLPTTTTSLAAASLDVRVYFLHGDTLDVAHRTITATQQVATAAMTELLAGPTAADVTAGLATTVPGGTRLLGINVANATATVDLSGEFANGGGSLSMAARLAQVTYTLTQFPTVAQVVFHLDGKPVTVFGGEGIILDHPATRASFESLTPPILVEFPGRGWAAQSPIQITGTANVFEAQFQAELTDSTGAVLARQTVHATSGTGTRGSFDTTIAYHVATSGPGTLTVFDTSPKDGSRIDTVQIPVQLIAS
jgi:germination protein M